MAVRTLTDVYVLMRNNAMQRRDIYCDQTIPADRMSLIRLTDPQYTRNTTPPSWTSHLDEAHFTLNKLSDKINHLKVLHARHHNRPQFDESTDEELEIENTTQDISRMFTTAHRHLNYVRAQSGSFKEQRLNRNVTKALATYIQELLAKYRAIQSMYLRRLNSREEHTKLFDAFQSDATDSVDYIDECFAKQANQKLVNLSSFEMEENTRVAAEREKEIQGIVTSIVELNGIYKELATMVMEQGTVLDRIDYNIENTHFRVQEGYRQLRKADEYLRSNSKMYCIFVLATTTIIMTFLLIVVKF